MFAFPTRLTCLSFRLCTNSRHIINLYFYERRKPRSGYFCERRVYVETALVAIRDMSPLFCAWKVIPTCACSIGAISTIICYNSPKENIVLELFYTNNYINNCIWMNNEEDCPIMFLCSFLLFRFLFSWWNKRSIRWRTRVVCPPWCSDASLIATRNQFTDAEQAFTDRWPEKKATFMRRLPCSAVFDHDT